MADHVEIDEGSSGRLVNADDCGAAGLVQGVKLCYSADGTATYVTADANGLEVQVTSAPAVRALTNADVVTAELSATDNAVLDAIAAAVATEGDALGDGVLLQGDDGTDRTNVLVDTDGHLQVDVLANPSQAVTNTGTFAVQAAQGTAASLNCTEASASAIKTAAELIDDTVYVDDADWTDSTSKHLNVGGVYNDAALNTITDGDVGPVALDVNGSLWNVGNRAHDAVDAGNPIKVGGKASSAVPSAVAANDRVNAWYDLNGRSIIAGGAAADAATSTAGNPVLLGGKSLAIGTATTDVDADADVVNLLATRGGRLYVTTAHPNRVYGCVADHNTAQTNHSLIAATGSAATSLYITDIMISNGATAGDVKLLDGSGGTVLWQVYLAINGGCAIQLHTPIKLTANTALCFTSTSVTTHTVAASGFISAP